MSNGPGPLPRLDPDAAAQHARTGPSAGTPPEPFDPRRYRWAIALIGLALVAAFSVYQLTRHAPTTTGVAPGHRLRWFAAPLAASDLSGDPNLHPPCTAADHDPRALNLCLDARRGPVVVSFFVPGARACERQVDALQALARRYAGTGITFAAVAVHAGHATAAHAARVHGWTIPVAYDRDGSVGALYGVAACPMAELAGRGGTVRDRLIGDRWQTATQLAPRVAALARPGG